MSIGEAREIVLRNYMTNTPDGAKRIAEAALYLLPHSTREIVLRNFINNNPEVKDKIAEAALYCLPYPMLKRITEALDLEEEAKELKSN